MRRLVVFLRFPDGQVAIAGELAFADLRADGSAPSAFRYAPEWLERAGAFALDPESLPLRPGEFRASHLGPPLGVFDDSLPDDWGRRLLVLERRLPRAEQVPARFLLESGADTMGALAYGPDRRPPTPRRRAGTAEDLAGAAERFDAGETLDDATLHRLFEAGSTPGGARPKAIVMDGGDYWIAKFPSRHRDEGHDVPGLEAACLALAAAAGIPVPENRLLAAGARHILLTRRFDLTASGRHHMISLRTLCRERGGTFALSYDDPMGMVRKHSADPAADVADLFRRMVFNAAIGNTDDHLKNFAMRHMPEGYRLSPAYDLVPNLARNLEHVLAMGHGRMTPTGGELVDLGAAWLGSRARAVAAVEAVAGAVADFADVAAKLGVSSRSVEFFAADIGRRLARLGSG